MPRRRDGLAPYEIMGAAPGGAAGNGAPAADEPVAPRRSVGDAVRDLWDAGVPVTVRVPRGVAVLVCVALLGLMVLAYWVGYSRGSAAVRAEMADELAQLDRAVGRAPLAAGRLGEVPVPDLTALGAGDEPVVTRGGDPRRPGQNYLIIARYPREEADRLARFLGSRGVETLVVPDHNDWFHVVGLRGFSTEEYRSGAHAEYERQVRQLGRDWQAANGGKGHNLSDMYMKLYTGPQP